MNFIAEDILVHYGVKRRSGRYPYGSGENPFQHSGDFLSRIEELKKQGFSEKEIADSIGLSTTELRVQKRQAAHERREDLRAKNQSLIDDGLSRAERSRILDIPESSLRSLEDEDTAYNKNSSVRTADTLREVLKDEKMVEIGSGVERELGVSKDTLNEAAYILEREGYERYGISIPQPSDPTKRTTLTVLANPEYDQSYAYNHTDEIGSVIPYHSDDGGNTFDKLEYPASMDSSRVYIKYGDQGGLAKDGLIEIRRGVEDLDMGNSHYAQVRIMVDNSHYLKGMAMYSDDIPDGYDVVFNTNKDSGTDKYKVFKEIQKDPDNPFGAYIPANGQTHYIDINGERKLSPINKLKEEGDWDTMSRNLSQQFLSKQPVKLISNQLNVTYGDYESQYQEIMSLQNPTLKKKMLLDFASECDSATVTLKAASLPRQRMQVLLPLDILKENEIYAPNYNDGEEVVLIRYPHGGTFEIPRLTVNNKNQEARKIMGTNPIDAVGINSRTASILSGADFDGDTAVVIPIGKGVNIKTTRPLDALKDFDHLSLYKEHDGMKYMSKKQVNKQMGIISNLITDMTLGGAPEDEIARAVKHSMVVIDAYKHKLDYKKSEKDNGIQELKDKWQHWTDDDGNDHYGGAATLLSRRKQAVEVPERQGSMHIDKETGEAYYTESHRKYVDKKTGEVKAATTKVPRMMTVSDAHKLSTGTPQEELYAEYANKMKALANQARKDYLETKGTQYNSSAAKVYKEEVDSLKNKLDIAERNRPRERKAQALANSVIKAKVDTYPELKEKENKKALNKIKQQAIQDARLKVGARGKDTRITITDREWEAIQAGAISSSMSADIFRWADQDKLKERALPKATTTISLAKQNKIESMRVQGYTNAQIAESIGVSVSTVTKYINQ